MEKKLSPVILHGTLIAERRGAYITVEHLTGVGSQHVAGQAGSPRKLRLAVRALERLVRRVSLQMAGQRLLVLEGGAALGAGERLAGRVIMQFFVHSQVIFS